MKLLRLVGRHKEYSDYIEFSIAEGRSCDSSDYEFYINEDDGTLLVNDSLESDQIKLVLNLLDCEEQRRLFIEAMSQCGYGL